MAQTSLNPTWQTLPNPFLKVTDTSEVITGHVSGRSTDITKVIVSTQSALLITGAPSIGKSALIHYLARPSQAEWSWRNEIESLPEQLNIQNIQFVLVDLIPFETIENQRQLLHFFIKQCNQALQVLNPQGKQPPSAELTDLYRLVKAISSQTSDARYFLMFDAIERLDRPGMKLFEVLDVESRAQEAHERSLALLDRCGAIHTLIDLMDKFTNFGAIIALESLPRPTMGEQFTYVSADLARFQPMTLQTFTWKDTLNFLKQPLENFGASRNWAEMFRTLGGSYIFSDAEQVWIRRYAGTHPYLLQQFCVETFHYKQEHASQRDSWIDLNTEDEKNLLEVMSERLSTFLNQLWRKRLLEAIENSNPETRNKFYDFIRSLASYSAEDTISPTEWKNLGSELRYILTSEGIVRSDPFQDIHYPGAFLCQYLAQKGQEYSPSTVRGFWLTMTLPGNQRERISLSELEYLLMRTLKQHPKRCTEEELIKGAWNKPVEHQTFTQRIHHLRKKLRDKTGGVEVIENHYGGQYSLNYPEWFELE